MKKQAKHIILGIHVTDRTQHAGEVQRHLTEFGRYIKTRLGLHEVGGDGCAPSNGLILIEMLDVAGKKNQLKKRLSAIKGVGVKEMVFSHS